MPASDRAGDERVLDAALRCVARWGVAKTTLDDIAREAGISRATIYRTYQGGKSVLLDRLAHREVARCFLAVELAIDERDELDEVLAAGISAAARFLSAHDALRFLLAHEPDAVLPLVAFHHFDRLLAAVSAFAHPHLARFLPDADVDAAAEWVARVVLSYTLHPDPNHDLRDEARALRLVRAYLIPGLVSEPATT
jgi:AcrR family transcriptional regulator